jgi:hypothetical protein
MLYVEGKLMLNKNLGTVAAGLPHKSVEDRLWLHIGELAAHGVYLTCTDHLTDGEFYERVINLLENNAGNTVALDYGKQIVVPCLDLETEQETFLAVYADDDVRVAWAELWPEDNIPAQRPRVANRDMLLARLRCITSELAA